MLKIFATATALSLLVGLPAPAALAAKQMLKFKLAYFLLEQKDGENHFMGVTIAPDGTLGTKEFWSRRGDDGVMRGHSTYYLPQGTINLTMTAEGAGTTTGGRFKGKYDPGSGAGAFAGATVTGAFEGAWGDQSPLKKASLMDIELDIKTP